MAESSGVIPAPAPLGPQPEQPRDKQPAALPSSWPVPLIDPWAAMGRISVSCVFVCEFC